MYLGGLSKFVLPYGVVILTVDTGILIYSITRSIGSYNFKFNDSDLKKAGLPFGMAGSLRHGLLS